MRHYIVDGYNALFKIKQFLKKHNRSREGFIRYIRTTRPFGSMRNRVTIVFDGSKDVQFRQKQPSGPVDVVFAKSESADDRIVKMAKKKGDRAEIIVVTDDIEVKDKVRMQGCKTMSVMEFFKKLAGKKEGKGKKVDEDEKPSPDSKEGKSITDEMKKIWGDYQ
jgi:predicted RNA-binding protein with PIN domain